MTSKKIKIAILALVLTTAFMSFTITRSAAAVPHDEIVSVNLIFESTVNEALLEKTNAQITYRYQTFPGISAYMPRSALKHITNNPLIRTWEYDSPVFLIDQIDSMDWGVDRIDADVVWGGSDGALDINTDVSGTNIKVAVIDTGIDYTHPDLAQRYAGGYDFVNDDDDPLDDHYHGTHCSGTIAATDDEPNALSGSLIGTAPEVLLYGVKVLDNRGSGTASGVAAGIDWAAANGMHVASLSLGASSGSDVIQAAGENAYAAGVLLVAASGNDGGAVGYPAAYPEFIAVGATEKDDTLASFSNYGPELELVAPGVDIMSTTPTYLDGGGPFNPSANYDTLSGTSMATPHVAGVAALVYSADPTLTNVQVRDIMASTAEDLGASGWDQYFGYGIVDAEAAVNAAGGTSGGGDDGDTTPPAKVTGLTATAVSTSQIDLAWDANSESDLSHYNIYRDGVKIDQTTTTSYSDTGLAEGTTYTYEVSAVDTSGNEGQKSDPASATTETSGTTDPGVMYVENIEMWVSRTRGPWKDISIRVTVVDGDGIALSGVTVTLDLELPSGSIVTYTGTTNSDGQVTFVYEKGGSGTYTATVTNLEADNYTYDPTLNVKTSETLTV